MSYGDDKELHQTLSIVGLRAQATAVGLIQLCRELRDVNVISEDALDRVKDAIARDITAGAARSVAKEEHRQNIRCHLDRLFAGDTCLGSARSKLSATNAEALA